ncbi:hypothetical protein L195_g037772 [Trifolium pratense]|uniref:F-box domain-containing protein n=1 Tax=Trifolium pratense TaxID=57577 RepID=A0A2K3LTA2_TRIPR|nr:hypothetical protein L195_g037772 [Trifolium pratense]
MYLNDTVFAQPVIEPNTNNDRMPFLPSELIVEILLKIPAKYLLRFSPLLNPVAGIEPRSYQPRIGEFFPKSIHE